VYYGETLEGAVSACTPGIRVRAPHVRRSVSVQTELHAYASALVLVVSAGYIYKRAGYIYIYIYIHTHTCTSVHILYFTRTDTRAVRRRSSVRSAARSSPTSTRSAKIEEQRFSFFIVKREKLNS